MRRTPHPQLIAPSHRALAHGEAIEWEELPSLADSVARRRAAELAAGAVSEFGSAWSETTRSGFDVIAREPEPFREALQGLHMREVNEPDVFRHFFGKPAGA